MASRRASNRIWTRGPLFLAASLVGHAAVLAALVLTGAGRGCAGAAVGDGAGAGPELARAGGDRAGGPADEDLDAACLADVALTTLARATACFVPGPDAAPRDVCLAAAFERLELERIACRRVRPLDVALLEPRPLDPSVAERVLPPDEAEPEHKEDEADPRGQVVEIPRPAVEERPDDARFVSEYDSRVERETVARGRLDPAAVSSPVPPTPEKPEKQVAKPAPPAPPTPPAPPARQGSGAGALAMRERTGSGSNPEKAATPGGSPDGQPVEEVDGHGPRRGEGGATVPGGTPAESPGGGDGRPLPSMSDLRPSQEALTRAVGAGSSDYLKDVDEGAQTLLNTKRWKFAGFFNRVKRAVAQNWHPDVAYRLRDPSGRIYGYKNRLTVLKVSLHPNGTLRDVLIEKPSGVDFLDDEAVHAFRQAQPFPNPPPGLVDKESKLITFRFGFFFEITEGPSFKVFRYNN